MRHVRMLGLCLVAALAVGAYAVSSASALEWGKCEYVGSGGKYGGPGAKEGTGQNCAKSEKAKPKGTGEYEWRKASEVAEKRLAEEKPANIPFSGESVEGGGLLTTGSRQCEYAKGYPTRLTQLTRQACAEAEGEESVDEVETLYVECAKENNTGETEGKNKIANVHVLFTGCAALGVIPCHSEGKEEGEIETNTLKGKLGWINKAAREVGVVLEPASHHGLFTNFFCGTEEFGVEFSVGSGNKKQGAEFVKGEQYPEGCYGLCPGATPTEEKHGGYDGVISPITPVNQMTNEFKQVYTADKEYPYTNIPSNFERKHLDVLEDWGRLYADYETEGPLDWSDASEEITNVNTPEEEGEIKA